MASAKCGKCGFVNWSGEPVCKRCSTPLLGLEPRRETSYSSLRMREHAPEPLWSGRVKLLGILAAVGLGTAMLRLATGDNLLLLVISIPELLVGTIALLVGLGMLVATMFRTSLWWIFALLVLPFVPLVFVVLRWYEAKRAFMIGFFGFALIALGNVTGRGLPPYADDPDEPAPPPVVVPLPRNRAF